MIEKLLKDLGFTEIDVHIYLHLLPHGASIASVIAKRLGLKRSTIYQSLERLEEEGLIVKYMRGGVAHFDATDPVSVVTLCEEKLKTLQHLRDSAKKAQDELENIRSHGHRSTVEVRETVKYYEGIEDVSGLIDNTLREKGGEQLCFGLNLYHTKIAGEDWQIYTKQRVDQGMQVKSIQPDTETAVAYQKRDSKELRETRLVPASKFPGHCEINIIGDTVAVYSFEGSTPTGLKLKNKHLSQGLRSLFHLAWEQAKVYDGER